MDVKKIYEDAAAAETWRQASTGIPGSKYDAGFAAIEVAVKEIEKDRLILLDYVRQLQASIRNKELPMPVLYSPRTPSEWLCKELTL